MKFEFNETFELVIQLEDTPATKLQLLSEFSKVNNKCEPMLKWHNNPDIPAEEKKKYEVHKLNAIAGMSLMFALLQRCGISEQEILEYANLPF